MISCQFEQAKTLLCLGAHSDDIEIGCGATLLQLTRARPDLSVWWVVFTADGRRIAEARSGAHAFRGDTGQTKVIVKRFRNGFFPSETSRIKEFFELLKNRLKPDVIFTHYRHDRHQDHRVISDLTWNTFRDHLILEYEVPKYDGDLGSPNFFVPLAEPLAAEKVKRLLQIFGSQRDKHWFSEDVFLGLMRLRAVEAGSPARYAEAFYCRKMVLGGAKDEAASPNRKRKAPGGTRSLRKR